MDTEVDTTPGRDGSVEYSREGDIAWIKLNRPRKLNALTDDMIKRLRAALVTYDEDEDARVAILHGAGKGFCAGADVFQRQLRSRKDLEGSGGSQRRERLEDVVYGQENWKPIIGLVHGYAIGAGLGLLLECEIVVADVETRFRVAETARGLGGTRNWALLRQKCNPSFADELALTDREFGAAEAREHGVINFVAEGEQQLYEQARKYARLVADNPPLAVRLCVRTRRWELETAERLGVDRMAVAGLHESADFHESASAWAEGRPPERFVGA